MRGTLRGALNAPPPNESDIERVLDEMVAQTPTESPLAVDPKGFGAALGIFVALLVLSIVVDGQNWVDDPSVYVSLAATALGAVLGSITGEISGSSTGQ
jgi:hypothetical protein